MGNQAQGKVEEKVAIVANLPEVKHDPESKRDPFRGLARNMVANHSERVGRGFLAGDGTVVRSIHLADGSCYEIRVKRMAKATVDVDPFPRRKKKAKKSKTS